MRAISPAWVLALLLVPVALGGTGGRGPSPTEAAPPPGFPAAPPWMGRFEENLGQAPGRFRFLLEADGFQGALTVEGAEFHLPHGGIRGDGRVSTLRMRVEGAQGDGAEGDGAEGDGAFEAGEPLPGRTHHLRGRDSRRWVRGARSFDAVLRRGILPGVDLRWRFEGARPAYDFLLGAGADPADLVLRFEGAARVRVDPDGGLSVATRGGILRHGRPRAWQESKGGRRPVAVAFEGRGEGRAGFRVGPRDETLPLVIDPVVSYASYLGSEGTREAAGFARDAAGRIHLVATCSHAPWVDDDSLDDVSEEDEVILVVLSPPGSRLEYATYLGGAGDDAPAAVAVDGDGSAWIAGRTASADFPAVSAHQGSMAGYADAFLLRLTAPGDDLHFSTFFGGTTSFKDPDDGSTSATALALVPGAGAAIAGVTTCGDLPLLDPFQGTHGGWYTDGFVAGFSGTGSLLHSSYLGGDSYDSLDAIAAAADGSIAVAGWTQSSDFPEVGTAAGIHGTGVEAVLARIAPGGGSLAWSYAFGGASYDRATGVDFLPSGEVLVGGVTNSGAFPVVNPVQSKHFSPGGDGSGFLSVFAGAGDALTFSTCVGNAITEVTSVAAGPDGSLFAAATTRGVTPPLVAPLQGSLLGIQDTLLVRIGPARDGYALFTYLGGTGFENPPKILVEDEGHFWVMFDTDSTDIATKGAFQPLASGSTDTCVVRVTLDPGPPSSLDAFPLSGTIMRLAWLDDSDDETGFELQRSPPGGPFATVALPGEDAVAVDDPGLAPLTEYSYRIRALRPGGPTDWSAAVAATTPDIAPFPPTSVAAVPAGSSGMTVTWTAGSANATSFEVLRRAPGGSALLHAVLPAGAVSFEDSGLLPARSFGYAIRARNGIGGTTSAEVLARTEGSLDPALARGTLVSSAGSRRDRVWLDGTLEGLPGLSPLEEGFTLRLGDEEEPVLLLEILPASGGWRAKNGKWSWRGAVAGAAKARLDLVPAASTFRLTLSGLDLAASPAADLDLWIGSGLEAGFAETSWEEAKPGSGKFRFPAR